MLISTVGRIEPLCDSCCTTDCNNPIEFTGVSEFGVLKKHRIYKSPSGAMAVVACKGYMNSEKIKQDE